MLDEVMRVESLESFPGLRGPTPWKVREFGRELYLGEGLIGEGAVNSDDSEGALYNGVRQRQRRTA